MRFVGRPLGSLWSPTQHHVSGRCAHVGTQPRTRCERMGTSVRTRAQMGAHRRKRARMGAYVYAHARIMSGHARYVGTHVRNGNNPLPKG